MNKRKTILHFVPWAHYGGVEHSVLNLCAHQNNNNHIVLFLMKGPITEVFSKKGIENYSLDSFPLGKNQEMAVHNIVKKADILHIHDLEYTAEIFDFVKIFNKPYLLTLQGRAVLPKLHCPIICVSEALAKEQDPENIHVIINNGIDTQEFSPPKKHPTLDKFIMMRVCRPERCASYFLDAIEIVLKKYPFTEIWLIGEEGESTHNIKYLGICDDVPSLLKQAHLFVYAPYPKIGGHDLTVLQSMATGLPQVVTDISCVSESVTHMHDGLLVPFGDLDEFSQAISFFIDNENTRQLFSKNARQTVLKKFDIREKIILYDKIYKELYMNGSNFQ